MKAHLSTENIITFLLTTPMFENLDPMEIREIVHIVEKAKYGPGETIFREGSPGDAWYALYRGEVDVLKELEAGEYKIRTLGAGACFGEIAVLDGSPRTATIRAVTDTTVLRIPQDKFQALVADEHLVAYKLIKHMAFVLAEKQRENTEKLSELLRSDELPHVQEGIKRIVDNSIVRE